MPIFVGIKDISDQKFCRDTIFSVFYILLEMILNRDRKSFESLHDLYTDYSTTFFWNYDKRP